MRWLRPTRTHLLLGVVVVLLATVPVLIPLMWTSAPASEGVRLAASPGVPALPRGDGATTSPAPRRSRVAPAPAGSLASVSPTPSPTPELTTTAPPAVPPPGPPPAPQPTTADPTSAQPTGAPTVLAAGPDLVVTSVSWTESPGNGTPVTFAAVVLNAGTDPTPAVTHGIAFLVDGAKVTWSANSSEPLGPGEERVYTADGGEAGSTWTATSGTHTVEAVADDINRIPETNEGDNTATTTLVVP